MEENKANGYALSKDWFEFAFESQEVRPIHTALYLYLVELNNRLCWIPVFGVPSYMTMEALNIKSHKTFIKTLNDLNEFGFIKILERSKNQYTSNSIALVKNAKAQLKALSKAMAKAGIKAHSEALSKALTLYINQETKKPIKPINNIFIPPSLEEFQAYFLEYAKTKYSSEFPISKIKCYSFAENSYNYWFDDNNKEWDKAKRKNWKKTVENKVRKESTKLKDWEIANSEPSKTKKVYR